MIDTRRVKIKAIYYQGTKASTASSSTTQSSQSGTQESGSSAGSTGEIKAGAAVQLSNAPFYYTSNSKQPSTHKSGTFYVYDGKDYSGRYRITNTAARCGKTPVGKNVTGWVPGEYLTGGGSDSKQSTASTENTGKKKQKTYNGKEFSEETGTDIESLTYTDSAADNSDSIDITINAQDSKWLKGWMPEKGATIKPTIIGENWSENGDGNYKIKCGLFILDDISYSDRPSTLSIGGVSKPTDENFSELEREYVWKNTSIKRIAKTIASRYDLEFTYDAEDYDIECDEQDATDSSYLNTLCKNYGLILKVYAKRLWIYDREVYKAKKPVKTFGESDIIRGSLSWSTTLYGTFTGGYFSYTDADKDVDITCSVGGGLHTKNVNRRATSVHDASIQLCAEINNANHGKTKLKFSVAGEWKVCSGHVIAITGYGAAGQGGLNGKYFVDKVTHKFTSSGGFTSDIECSLIEKPFYHWEVGGSIEKHAKEEKSKESYESKYEETSPAANAASQAGGAQAGAAVQLSNAPFYVASTSPQPATHKSGTFYFYDGILVAGRYRITNTADRCGKLPVGKNVTGWVPASYCTGGSGGKTDGGTKTDLK